MLSNDRLSLAAPCGIDCGICELHTCKDDPRLMDHLLTRGIPKEKLPCAGCRSIEGNCPVIGVTCETYTCVRRNGVQFCFECAGFPCSRLGPAADRAEVLPHNMKVFNLCTIQRMGVESFIQGSTLIKRRYFSGKMEIGKGPQVTG
jgi:Protein of unknown function (DUF3795)